MELFAKETCVCCGKQTGLIERTKLADKKFLCMDCVEAWCSKDFEKNYLLKQTSAQFFEYVEHKKENRKKLEAFEKTDGYFDCVAVDMNKGWFIFGKNVAYKEKEELISKNYEVFEAKDLTYYDFAYDVKNVKEGIFNSNVKADVLMTVGFENKWYPYAYSGKVLKNYKHAAEITGIINRTATFIESQYKGDFELYLLSTLMNNGIDFPVDLGKRFTKKVDLEPYRPYFKKMFEIARYNGDFDLDMERKLKNISQSPRVRKQIKKEFKVRKH